MWWPCLWTARASLPSGWPEGGWGFDGGHVGRGDDLGSQATETLWCSGDRVRDTLLTREGKQCLC